MALVHKEEQPGGGGKGGGGRSGFMHCTHTLTFVTVSLNGARHYVDNRCISLV